MKKRGKNEIKLQNLKYFTIDANLSNRQYSQHPLQQFFYTIRLIKIRIQKGIWYFLINLEESLFENFDQ